MKQHTSGIAKVVNPLGTVVTVHSDGENDIEVFEDAVIHENCDEALFRPVVASNAVVLVDPKVKTNALPTHKTTVLEEKSINSKNIVNSSFETTKQKNKNLKLSKEDAVLKQKLNEQNHQGKERNFVLSKIQTQKNINLLEAGKSETISGILTSIKSDFNLLDNSLENKKSNSFKSKLQISNFSDKVIEFTEKFNEENLSDKSKKNTIGSDAMKSSKEIENSDVPLNVSQKKDGKSSVDLQQRSENKLIEIQSNLDNENSLPSTNETVLIKKVKNKKLEKSQVTDQNETVSSSSEEKTNEEKQLTKKPRKIKPKLGVRIASPKEDFDIFDKKNEEEEEPYVQVTLRPPKKSWCSIASSNSSSNPIDDKLDKNKEWSTDSTKKSTKVDIKLSSDLKENIDNVFISDGVLEPKDKSWPKIIENEILEDLSLIKINKSDDEKQENSSSPAETTESDDSAKVNELVAMDVGEDFWQPEIKAVTKNSKKTRRKHR